MSLYVAPDGGGSSSDTTTQLLWCVARTQASRCLLLVPLAFCLNQLIECERLAGLDDMKDNAQSSGSFKKSLCLFCLRPVGSAVSVHRKTFTRIMQISLLWLKTVFIDLSVVFVHFFKFAYHKLCKFISNLLISKLVQSIAISMLLE